MRKTYGFLAGKELFVFLGEDAVGLFTFVRDGFHFRYLKANLNRSEPIVIPDFPDVRADYLSPVPFPFLELRLPSSKRASIQEEIEREGLKSLYDLLLFYGQQSATSPFDLVPKDGIVGESEFPLRKSAARSTKPTPARVS